LSTRLNITGKQRGSETGRFEERMVSSTFIFFMWELIKNIKGIFHHPALIVQRMCNATIIKITILLTTWNVLRRFVSHWISYAMDEAIHPDFEQVINK